MIEVKLTDSELETAIDLGIRREMYWHLHGIDNRWRKTKKSGWRTQIQGAIGEIGVCKHYNVEPDLSAVLRPDEIDCVIKGKTVDVKTIEKLGHSLMSPPHKAKYMADFYLLVYAHAHDVLILGWAYGSDLFSESTLGEHGYGATHTIKQDSPLFHKL